MKKVVCAVVTLMILCGVACADTYGLVAVVVRVRDEVVTCQDFFGNLWCFEEDDEWNEGDVVAFVMNDMNTPGVIEDDEITSVTFNGYLSLDAMYEWIAH